MERPDPRALAFSHWLRTQMTSKDISQRALGKQIDGDNPERGRRQVVRHLSGQHFPSKRLRRAYATVFGEEYVEEDDEEGDLAGRLKRLAREAQSLARLVEERAVGELA
jgi:hypothetical protein